MPKYANNADELTAKLGRLVQINLPFNKIEEYGPALKAYGLGAEFGLDAPSLEGLLPDRFDYWAGQFADRRNTIHGPFMDLAPGGGDPAVVAVTRRRLSTAIELISAFGAEAIIFHAAYDDNRYMYRQDQWLDVSVATWEQVLRLTESSEVMVCLENTHEQRPDMMIKLFDRLDHPRLGLCFDTGHQNTWSDAPLTQWLDALGDRLVRLHLHDNDGSFDHHKPIGQGNFPFEKLFNWLKNNDKKPGITLEPHALEDVEPMVQGLIDLIDNG